MVGDASAVLLDGSRSSDPDSPSAALAFAWACAPLTPGVQGCLTRAGTPAALGGAATQQLQLKGAEGAGNVYNVTLTVSSAKASASAWTLLTFLTGSGPVVQIAGLPQAKANPAAKVTLLAAVSSLAPQTVAARWAQTRGPPLNLSDPAVALTPVTSASLVLAPGALSPGAAYAFQLNATDAYGAGSATVAVVASRAPRGVYGPVGALAVSPLVGSALSTPFQLSATDWVDEDGPLSFQYSYLLPGSSRPVALSGFRADFQSVAFQLPSADPVLPTQVTVQLRVQNAFGAVSVAPVNATVTVSWAPGSLSYQSVASKVSDARRLALDGRAEDALSVVGALSVILNAGVALNASYAGGGQAPAPSAPPLPGRTQAQAVRAAFRADLLSIVALVRPNQSLRPFLCSDLPRLSPGVCRPLTT